MARAGLALVAAAGAFLLAGAAQAKAPPGGVDVCGQSGCVHLAWAEAEQFWVHAHNAGGLARPAPGPFYVLRWHWISSEEESAYLVPLRLAVRWNSGTGHAAAWGGVDRSAIELIEQAAARIDPYPTPTLTRVTVGGRAVREPQTYFKLLSGKQSWTFVTGAWLRVKFESSLASPWTDGTSIVRISMQRPYVSIDGWFYRIPRDVAQRARRGLSLSG